VVLLFWNSRSLPRVLRATLLIYVLLTVFATLGSGQHYLVDLVVSLPFALAVQAGATFALPNLSALPNWSRRSAGIIAGTALTILGLLEVRFGVSFALTSRLIPWSLIVLTASIVFWIENRMAKGNANAPANDNRLVAQQKLAASAR
jgi:hypothetical protein